MGHLNVASNAVGGSKAPTNAWCSPGFRRTQSCRRTSWRKLRNVQPRRSAEAGRRCAPSETIQMKKMMMMILALFLWPARRTARAVVKMMATGESIPSLRNALWARVTRSTSWTTARSKSRTTTARRRMQLPKLQFLPYSKTMILSPAATRLNQKISNKIYAEQLSCTRRATYLMSAVLSPRRRRQRSVSPAYRVRWRATWTSTVAKMKVRTKMIASAPSGRPSTPPSTTWRCKHKTSGTWVNETMRRQRCWPLRMQHML